MTRSSIYERLADDNLTIGDLLFREDRDTVRGRILSEPEFQPIVERLTAEGERFLGEPITELPWTLFRRIWEDGFRKTYEPVFFSRRQRLTAFGLLSWLHPDRSDYLDALLDTVWAICGEYSWCVPVHFVSPPSLGGERLSVHEEHVPDPGIGIDLFAAETAFALAEIMMLTGHRWPETIRDRVYGEVYRRVFAPFVRGDFFWEHVRNNWASVCAGSIGAAAIYLIADRQELAVVLDKALPTIDLFLEGYGDDGACPEGYMYWGYGFGFYAYFAELLSRRTNGAIDLLADPKVKQVALFPQHCFLHGRKVVNFSDSPEEADAYIGLTHEMARRYPEVQRPIYSFQDKAIYDHCGRWAPAFRNLIWYEPGMRGEAWKEASVYLADAQWFVSRAKREGKMYSFAAKGGNNDEPHNHNDVGHFILLAGEETFLADMGAGLYTRPYFEPETRYGFIGNSGLGHSVPIIDGRSQQAGAACRAVVRQAEVNDDSDRFVIEMQDAYGIPGLAKLQRSWTWHRNGELPWLELEDRYEFSERADRKITERFISPVQPIIASPGRVELVGAAYKLVIRYDDTWMEPFVETLPFLDHFGHQRLYYALDMRVRASDDLVRKLYFSFTILG